MTVSRLTTTEDSLFTSMVLSLTDYTFAPLTHSKSQYLATVASGLTGASHSHLRTPEKQLLALIAAELSGGSVSELTSGEEELLEVIVNNPGGGTPAWLEEFRATSGDLPSQALDFLSVNYWNGDDVAVINLLGNRGFAPLDTFDPASIGAEGLDCSSNTSSVAAPQNELLTKLRTNNWTLVIEFKHNAALDHTSGAQPVFSLLTALNSTAEGSEGLDFWVDPSNFGSAVNFADYNGNTATTSNGADRTGAVNKVAATFTSGKIAVSLNGEAVAEYSGPTLWDDDWLIYTIGKADGGGLGLQGWIRSLAIYDPQPNADLPSLSALT